MGAVRSFRMLVGACGLAVLISCLPAASAGVVSAQLSALAAAGSGSGPAMVPRLA